MLDQPESDGVQTGIVDAMPIKQVGITESPMTRGAVRSIDAIPVLLAARTPAGQPTRLVLRPGGPGYVATRRNTRSRQATMEAASQRRRTSLQAPPVRDDSWRHAEGAILARADLVGADFSDADLDPTKPLPGL